MAAAIPPLLPRRLAAAVAAGIDVYSMPVVPTAEICSYHCRYMTVAMAMDQGVDSNSADAFEDAAAAAVAEAMGRVNIEEGLVVALLQVHLRLHRRRMDCS